MSWNSADSGRIVGSAGKGAFDHDPVQNVFARGLLRAQKPVQIDRADGYAVEIDDFFDSSHAHSRVPAGRIRR